MRRPPSPEPPARDATAAAEEKWAEEGKAIANDEEKAKELDKTTKACEVAYQRQLDEEVKKQGPGQGGGSCR